MQKWMTDNLPGYKAALDASPLRYEAVDPTVAEIAILAAMHNMASALRDAGPLKAAINAAIKERAGKL